MVIIQGKFWLKFYMYMLWCNYCHFNGYCLIIFYACAYIRDPSQSCWFFNLNQNEIVQIITILLKPMTIYINNMEGGEVGHMDWFIVLHVTFSNIMVTSFSGGGSWSTQREPPTMGKQLVNFITCGCESSAPFFVIYKAGREPMPYWR